jgi:shikimate kinase
MDRNIALIGFMGSGKSTVGMGLARTLSSRFIETDSLIEEKIKKPIKDIFEEMGEERFRDIEQDVVVSLEYEKDVVIGCGGGVILRKANVESLRRHATLILLSTDKETTYHRLEKDTDRPLISGKKKELISLLLDAREGIYRREADLTINTIGKSPSELINEIREKMANFGTENTEK